MNDSSESIVTTKIRQKVDDQDEVSSGDLSLYFNNNKQIVEDFCLRSQKEWKKTARGFKKLIFLDKLRGYKRVDDLVYSVECATDLKRESFDNYRMLLEYGDRCLERPSEESILIYSAFKDYCDSFDQVSTRFNCKILTRPTDRSLIPFILDMEDEKTAVVESGKDLIDHVRQVVQIDNDTKRLVK